MESHKHEEGLLPLIEESLDGENDEQTDKEETQRNEAINQIGKTKSIRLIVELHFFRNVCIDSGRRQISNQSHVIANNPLAARRSNLRRHQKNGTQSISYIYIYILVDDLYRYIEISL